MVIKQEKCRLNILVSKSLYGRLNEMSLKFGETKSDFIRQAVEHELERRKNEELKRVVAELAPLYETDEDLLAFTNLDSEDFL